MTANQPADQQPALIEQLSGIRAGLVDLAISIEMLPNQNIAEEAVKQEKGLQRLLILVVIAGLFNIGLGGVILNQASDTRAAAKDASYIATFVKSCFDLKGECAKSTASAQTAQQKLILTKLGCVLLIPPTDRTQDSVNACLAGP